MEFKLQQLGNGLTLIAEVAPAAASMAVGFFARTGSRDESDDVHGVSHFLEHMVFKGTARRTAFDVNREFDDLGAAYNAFTSEEATVYYGAVLPEFQARLVDLLGDILRPSLRQEDFDMEKQVILEEIALYEDRPDFRLYEQLMLEYFGEHPLGHRVLGTVQSIRSLTREAMLDYFRRRYSPGNIIVVASGNLDWDALVAQVTASCGHWEPVATERQYTEPPRRRIQRSVLDEKLVRQQVGLISPGPSAQSSQRYAARLLGAILGDDTGSRLYYALIEPAIVEDASTTYDPMDGLGAMLTMYTADADRSGEALQIVQREFAKLMDEGITAAELSAAKNKIASASVLRGELPMGRLSAVGFDWLYRHTYMPLDKQIEEMLAVTAEQVVDVARQFNLNDATVVSLGPKELF
jgi:predicted Zn-dependent peptidase